MPAADTLAASSSSAPGRARSSGMARTSPSQLTGETGQPVRAARDEHEAPSAGGQGTGKGFADPAGCAGDEGARRRDALRPRRRAARRRPRAS